jgi:hypothetical protein
MKNAIRTLSILWLLCLGANGADFQRVLTLTVTNFPASGNQLTINSDMRFASNAQSTVSFLINTTNLATMTTNIWTQIALKPYSWQAALLPMTNQTNIVIVGRINEAIVASSTGLWVSTNVVESTITTRYPLVLPLSSVNVLVRTNLANHIITGLSDYSTGAFAFNSQPLTNYVDRATAQWLTNKSLTAPRLLNPTLTNGLNSGNAFRSPGSGAASEQFGTAAAATGAASLALGASAAASEHSAIAIGTAAEASGTNSLSIGTGTIAGAFDSAMAIGGAAGAAKDFAIAIGYGANATETNSVAIGATATAQDVNSIALGVGVITDFPNTIYLGTSNHTNNIDGTLNAGIANVTNLYPRGQIGGSNYYTGALHYSQSTIGTVADGHNVITLAAGSIYTKLTGAPSTNLWELGGITGGYAGRMIYLQNTTGYHMRILDSSGTTPAAGDRILCPGAGTSTASNNAVVILLYDGGQSRWVMVR